MRTSKTTGKTEPLLADERLEGWSNVTRLFSRLRIVRVLLVVSGPLSLLFTPHRVATLDTLCWDGNLVNPVRPFSLGKEGDAPWNSR